MARRILGKDPHELKPNEIALQMAKQLVRCASHVGSDVRLAHCTFNKPNVWPRKSVDASRWQWAVILSVPYTFQRINRLEMKAIIASFNWKFRKWSNLKCRHVHLSDSQVSISVLTKGRTSSCTLKAAVKRFNALQLAAQAYPYVVYVCSAGNPAGDPSRWVHPNA